MPRRRTRATWASGTGYAPAERSQREWATRGASKERRNPKDGDKAQRDFRLNRTEKQASKVRITEKALARLEPVEKPWEAWDLHLDLTMARRSGDVVARLSGAVIHRGEWQLGPLDLEVRWADRLAIVGPNGSGKSTLLAALLGRVVLTSGALWTGPSVVVGELGQERRRFSEGDSTLLGAFMAALGPKAPESDARSLLAKFGLGASHVLRAAASLSPGERTRAELALLVGPRDATAWSSTSPPTIWMFRRSNSWKAPSKRGRGRSCW